MCSCVGEGGVGVRGRVGGREGVGVGGGGCGESCI